MTDVMSYQYPPPRQNGTEMDMPLSGYLPSYSVPAHTDPDTSIPSTERSDSFSESMKSKRSLSTPAVGAQQSQSQPPTPQSSVAPGHDAAAERRRNKLGYHRTSVACGHCRRRKIRCVPSQNDVQGRCINCIRLKKECSFYPVDQQPPLDTRQKSASRSSVGPKIASASSSPPMQTRIPADIHGQQPYPQLSVPAIQSMAPPMKPPGSENYPPDPRMSSSATGTRPYEYGHQEMTNWMSADASPSSSKPSDLNATWRSYPADSPLTPAFSPYTPHAPTVSATWSASEPSRDGVAWSSYPAPPSRSLPFGTEGMTSHQQYPSISQVSNHSSRAYVRKSSSSSEMYAPAIATTTPGIETVPGNTMDPNASLSAGTVPPSSYAPWQQSYPYSKPAESYGGWYGDAGTHQPLGPGAQHPSGHAHSGSGVYYGR